MPRPRLIDAIRPDKVERLSRELDEVNREHQSLQDEIARCRSIAESSEDENELLRADARARALDNRAKKIRARMAKLSSDLDLAKSEERRRLRARLLDDVQREGAALIAAARKLDAGPYNKALDELRLNGFRNDELSCPKMPMVGRSLVVAPDMLDRFESGLARLKERENNAPSRTPARRPVPVEVAPAANETHDAPAPQEKAEEKPESAQPRARRALFAEEPQDGKVLVQYLRANVELQGGGLSIIGDRINVDASTAESLEKNGAAQRVDAKELV